MIDLLIATQNKGKLKEYQTLFEGIPVRLFSLQDIDLGEMDVAETGETFTENAEIKARAYAEASGMLALADDSGLCVDLLDGGPGVYSARYAGEGASDQDRRLKLLQALATAPDEKRGAHFACAIVVFDPATRTPYITTGKCPGKIALSESDGAHGFGYDPIFIPDGYTVTLADITPTEKNTLSHRGIATQNMRPVLEKLLASTE